MVPYWVSNVWGNVIPNKHNQCPIQLIYSPKISVYANILSGWLESSMISEPILSPFLSPLYTYTSSQKTISIHWWSQQLSSNFKPHLHFPKILEKVVASRIQSHLSSNSLSSSFQSAYQIFHSTETTLLKIHNDLILAMDRGEVTSLILLDLSADFDTVDHSILLTRLQNWFGLDGLSLDWFSSYLSLRSQAVSINDSISTFSTLSCGVPQGSVLGPLLLTLYTTPLGSVISKNSLKYHLYADDTQLYISFTPTTSALSQLYGSTTVVMAIYGLHWKWQSLTPCQRHLSEPIEKIFGTIDYVIDLNNLAKFGFRKIFRDWGTYTQHIKRDLMAQRLARRAEDREVPGSSPTQD